ncbi:MAG: hypothetical protein ACLRSW_08875 [Christensenellaceae bacterium]
MDLKKKLGRIFSLPLSGCLWPRFVSCGGGNESSSQPGNRGLLQAGCRERSIWGLLEDGK